MSYFPLVKKKNNNLNIIKGGTSYGIQASGWKVWKSSWEILIHSSFLDGIAIVTEQKGNRPYEI